MKKERTQSRKRRIFAPFLTKPYTNCLRQTLFQHKIQRKREENGRENPIGKPPQTVFRSLFQAQEIKKKTPIKKTTYYTPFLTKPHTNGFPKPDFKHTLKEKSPEKGNAETRTHRGGTTRSENFSHRENRRQTALQKGFPAYLHFLCV